MGFPPAMASGISHQRIQPGASVHLPNTEAAEILSPARPAIPDQESAGVASSPTEQIVAVLSGLLPKGATVAVCWRDWALGSGSALSPGGQPGIAQARGARVVRPRPRNAASRNCWSMPGTMSMAMRGWRSLSACREAAADAERDSWLALAKTLLACTLDASRAQARIVSLEKSKRLQQALYEIADLASADLEMPEMLRRIHVVVGIADVRRQLLHRALRRPAPQRALPALRRPARSLCRRSRAANSPRRKCPTA